MRIAFLSFLGLAAVAAPLFARPLPPAPPPEFAQTQSPAKPAPFAVNLVDQGQFDPNLKGYFLPEGFRLEIVASEPDVINPVGMTFGPDGSLFVLEWRQDPVTTTWNEVKEVVRYRDGSTRQVATMRKFVTDLVKQLKYNPAAKTFGPAKPIIAEELPSSVLYHEGWLYVSGRGTVRRYRQSLPNGKWDVREVIAQGFCGFHHHQVSGLTLGNDGWLYITSGDDDNVVEGSDGSRAVALRTGAVFRCRPDGSKMEVFSRGYRNPYRDVAYDDRFNLFHADNDNEDGSKFMGCRLMHVAEGSDFGWRLKEGVRCCRPDLVRAAVAGELPGRMAPMLKTGRGAPAGLLIYNDTRIPEEYRGLLYYPDVFRKLVRAYAVGPKGSTFQVTGEFAFLKSDDPLFRPCQMVTGPDGAIYVCDWRTDSGGAGKLWGDGVHGRIYRIRWAGTKDAPELPLRGMDSWAAIARQTDEELVGTLGAPDFTDRVEARKQLVRRGPAACEAVRTLVADPMRDLDARLVGMGVLMAGWDETTEILFRKLLHDGSADVRRIAAEGLGMNAKSTGEATREALIKHLNDTEPAVRRAVALALGRLGGSADALVNSLKFEQLRDPYLTDGYIRAVEKTGKPGVNALLTLFESGEEKDRDLAVGVFSAMRIRPAAEVLPEVLSYPHLTVAQRETLVRSYANYQLDPPISLEPLAAFLSKRPDEPTPVVLAAVEVFGTTSATSGPITQQYLLGLLGRADLDTRLAVIQTVVSIRMKEACPTLLKMLADDHRDLPERKALLKAVRVTNDLSAKETIAALLRHPEPPALKVEALRTLATLAPEEAQAAAKDLLNEPDADLVHEAVAVLGGTKSGALLIGERFLLGKLPRNLLPQVTDALQKFSADPAAAAMRLEIVKGGLIVTHDPQEAMKIIRLVKASGDPKKGKVLYLNTKLLACATCHRLEGVGGSVGPDLTRVWDTQSVEKLLESILAPSKEIKEGYQTYRLVTAKGQTVTGLKVLETAKEVVVRDASGRDIHVAKDDIEQLSPSKVSLMPDDAVSQLTFDQFIDLLAFLKSRGEQESLRGTVSEYAVGGPTSTDLQSPPPDVLQDATGKAGGPWHVFPTGANGLVDLKEAFPAKPAGVHARVWVFAPKPQRAAAVLTAEAPVRLWLNGQPAFEQSPDKPGLQEGRFDVELHEGWNTVLIKMVNGGLSQRLGLRLTGDGLRTAAKPESPATR